MGKLASDGPNDQRSEKNNPTLVDHSIDELARGLVTGTLSRRQALRLLGAALVGGVLASIPEVALAAPPSGGQGCPAGTTRCGGTLCCNASTEECKRGGRPGGFTGRPRCGPISCTFPNPVCPNGTSCCCVGDFCICCPAGCGAGSQGPTCA
jgi:hypothetical protein